ncbi:O-antigen ligase family protein [Actinosynnema sp. CA-248983]
MTVLLRVLACVTVALAPLEGYLLEVHGHLAKVAPALLAVVWVVVRARERRFVTPHPLHAVLAAFAVVLLASTALHAGGPYAVDYLQRWLPFLLLTVILVDVVARDVPVRALLGAAVAGAVVAAVGALYSLLAEGEARASGPLEDPNDLAYFLVAALPLLAALAPVRGAAARRWVWVAVVALVLAAGAAATFSRGGALALAAAGAWLVARRVVPVKVLLGGIAALVVVVCGALVFAGPALDRALQEKSYIAGTNVDTRGLRWQAAARMVSAHPALGVGPGGFRDNYPAFSRNAEVDEQTPVAHNMYLEVAAELGVAGFGLFVGMLAVAAVSSERVLRVGWRREIAAVQASLIAVVVASTFLSQQYYLPLWSLVAVVVAADLRVRRADACAARDR